MVRGGRQKNNGFSGAQSQDFLPQDKPVIPINSRQNTWDKSYWQLWFGLLNKQKNGMDVSLWQRERMFYESNELMSHKPMGQIWKKIKVSVETIKFFSVFILWSTAIHGMKELSFTTRDRFSSSSRAQTSTHQMSKNIWVFERWETQ